MRRVRVSAQFEFTLAPHPIRGVMMSHPSGMRLELFQREGSAAGIQGAAPIEALATRGYGHFALSAPDIDPVFERAVAAGAPRGAPAGRRPSPGCASPSSPTPRATSSSWWSELMGRAARRQGGADHRHRRRPGAAAARLFAAEGATVFGCDLDAERAETVAAEIRAAGGSMRSRPRSTWPTPRMPPPG